MLVICGSQQYKTECFSAYSHLISVMALTKTFQDKEIAVFLESDNDTQREKERKFWKRKDKKKSKTTTTTNSAARTRTMTGLAVGCAISY